MRSARTDNRTALWLPLALFGAGLVSAAIAAVWQQRSNDALVQENLQATAERAADRVMRRMRLYEYGLMGARSAVLVAGSGVGKLSGEDFRRFGASQDIRRQYPGIVGFGFA